MEERLPRKLAAILYTDVAGYSRLTGEDEDATHRRLSEYLDLISATVEQYHGRVMHYAGDAVLAMFDAVVDALCCAAVVQRDLISRNENLPDERKVQFRIGVNMGDVIEDRDDIYGDGVNVAARLESLGKPGGICISDSVHTAVGNKLPLEYEFIGEQQVKNIAKPVKAYHARLKPGAELPSPTAISKRRQPIRAYILAATAIVLIIAGGILVWLQPWQPKEEPASIEQMAFPLPDKPSLAVMPFTNMTGDPEQEYFSDGITDDLITDLSKISGLFVIARNSTFAYKGIPVKVRQVAEELGVRYVLEGSVRRAGETVRINAQLIDATTGGHLWAERYDGSLTNVFALQDKVTQKIVSALAVNLTADEETRRTRKETDNPAAYDAFLEGWTRYRLFTPDDLAKAIPHLERAIELDPNYSRAHAALAAVYVEAWYNYWVRMIRTSARRGLPAAKRHLKAAMQNPTPLAHQVASLMSIIEGHYDEAIADAERAVALDPNDPSGYVAMARALLLAGRPAESIEFINKAARLDPRSDFLYWLGAAQFHLERYDEAAATLIRATEHNPGDLRSFLYLASAYGHLERQQDAKSAFETFIELRARIPSLPSSPSTYTSEQLNILLFKRKAETERLHKGLAKLGYELPPEVVEASPEGITFKKTTYTSAAQVYDAAAEYCRKREKTSILINASFPVYEFSCR